MRPGPARWPLKGLRAPLPRDVGNETLLCGLRRSCFRVWLLSFVLEELLAAAVEGVSTSISITKMELALDSYPARTEGSGSKASSRSPLGVKPTTSEHRPSWKHRFLRSQSSVASCWGGGEALALERGMGAVRKDEPLG